MHRRGKGHRTDWENTPSDDRSLNINSSFKICWFPTTYMTQESV